MGLGPTGSQPAVPVRDFSYAKEADRLAASVPEHDLWPVTDHIQRGYELVLARAQVYATLALKDALDEACRMLDEIAARLGREA